MIFGIAAPRFAVDHGSAVGERHLPPAPDATSGVSATWFAAHFSSPVSSASQPIYRLPLSEKPANVAFRRPILNRSGQFGKSRNEGSPDDPDTRPYLAAMGAILIYAIDHRLYRQFRAGDRGRGGALAVSRHPHGDGDGADCRAGGAVAAAAAPAELAGGDRAQRHSRHGDADLFRGVGVSACGAGGGGAVYRADLCAADLALRLWPSYRPGADHGGVASGLLGVVAGAGADGAWPGPSLPALLPVVAGALYAMGNIATREWCAEESAETLLVGFFCALGLVWAAGRDRPWRCFRSTVPDGRGRDLCNAGLGLAFGERSISGPSCRPQGRCSASA